MEIITIAQFVSQIDSGKSVFVAVPFLNGNPYVKVDPKDLMGTDPETKLINCCIRESNQSFFVDSE